MSIATENFVRIAYTTSENELTAEEVAVREELNAGMNQLLERYIQKSRLQDVLAIELYPTDDSEI